MPEPFIPKSVRAVTCSTPDFTMIITAERSHKGNRQHLHKTDAAVLGMSLKQNLVSLPKFAVPEDRPSVTYPSQNIMSSLFYKRSVKIHFANTNQGRKARFAHLRIIMLCTEGDRRKWLLSKKQPTAIQVQLHVPSYVFEGDNKPSNIVNPDYICV